MTVPKYSEEFLNQEVDMDNLTDEQYDAIFGESLAQAERGDTIDGETAFNIVLAELSEKVKIYEAKPLKIPA